jgi:hypothetical protein
MRSAAVATFLSITGICSADYQIKATIAGTGAGLDGAPAAGSYEIDYTATRARVVKPDGSVLLFVFADSQVDVLSATATTYKVVALNDLLSGKTGSSIVVPHTVDLKLTGQTQTLLGVGTSQVTISMAPVAMSPASPGNGNGQFTQFGRSGPVRPMMTGSSPSAGRGASAAQLSGSAWLSSTATSGLRIATNAPLLAVGAPTSIAAQLSNDFDSLAASPLAMSFTWISSNGTSKSLTMTIDSVTTTTFGASLMTVPSTYTLASN